MGEPFFILDIIIAAAALGFFAAPVVFYLLALPINRRWGVMGEPA